MPKKTAPKPNPKSLTKGDEAYYFLRELWLQSAFFYERLAWVDDINQMKMEAMNFSSRLKKRVRGVF